MTETTDFTDVNYISTLEYQLVSLFVKLVKMVEENTTHNEKFSTFLNGRSREIETSITNYLRKQFKVTAFSAVYTEEIDTAEIFEENKLLKETLKNLKTAFSTIIKLIDENTEITVPFSVYETFNSIVNTDVDNFASLDFLKVKKTAFDKDKF